MRDDEYGAEALARERPDEEGTGDRDRQVHAEDLAEVGVGEDVDEQRRGRDGEDEEGQRVHRTGAEDPHPPDGEPHHDEHDDHEETGEDVKHDVQ